MIPRVLVIAGSDSGGGAGIQADIKTVMALGGYATTAITAITAQNTLGVIDVMPMPAAMVLAQIDAVLDDIGADAVKIGMLGSAEVAHAVAERLRRPDVADVPVVFDPVMVATSGAVLADAATALAFHRLLTRATVSTPNLDELAALAGRRVGDEFAIEEAAGHLIEERGAAAILATGARLPGGEMRYSDGPRVATDRLLFDLLFFRQGGWQSITWHDERIDTSHDHGTGCTLSSAIAVGLGQGMVLPDAIARARAYVRAALSAAPGLGRGHGPMGHALGRGWPAPE